ncbi:MAG: hypothetical protein IPK82_06555 [Polyangiaceae bacterium]|nr:hypothetical protein [Polyangiaceae bacterium]
MDKWMPLFAFLVGSGLGVCIGMYVILSRILDRLDSTAANLTSLLREINDSANEAAADHRKHLDATASISVDQTRRMVQSLAVEIRAAAQMQVQAIRALHDQPADSGAAYPSRMEGSSGTPGVSTLPPDAPTPQSGYPLGKLWSPPREDV